MCISVDDLKDEMFLMSNEHLENKYRVHTD